MRLRPSACLILLAAAGCVPPGSAGDQDAGKTSSAAPPPPVLTTAQAPVTPPPAPAADLLRAPFEDNFDRTAPPLATAATPSASATAPTPSAIPSATVAAAAGVDPGADWEATQPGIWRIENGRLCGEHARNHNLWLKRTLP